VCKRIFLFIVTNFLIVLTLSLILEVLGVEPYLEGTGLNVKSLAIFCAVWGMGGAFLNLAISRIMAKWIYSLNMISYGTTNREEKELLEMVHEIAKRAKLPELPEVGIYTDEEPNAFATGPTKAHSLVAVSSGLLKLMNRDQLEAVIGHEISHIANDDMVTMTLLNGIVDAFVLFLSRAIAYAMTIAREENEFWNSRIAYAFVRWVMEIVFATIGALVICWFSRQREYRADAGAAKLVGRQKMASALQVLATRDAPEQQARRRAAPVPALMISGADAGILQWWSTHPSITDRINRLYEHDDPSMPTSTLPKRSTETKRSSNSLRDRFSSDTDKK
jgi:heat shock protein HtpX